MTPRAMACAAVLFASACAFGSERALFHAGEAVQPFSDGARFTWREDGQDDELIVVYRRRGAGYTVEQEGEREEGRLQVLLVAIEDTPEDDYIAQVQMEASGDARLYAFLIPIDGGHLIVAAPRAVGDQAEMAAFCGVHPQGDCLLERQEQAFDLYRQIIYPRYVAGAAQPSDYMMQTPAPQAAAKRPEKS